MLVEFRRLGAQLSSPATHVVTRTDDDAKSVASNFPRAEVKLAIGGLALLRPGGGDRDSRSRFEQVEPGTAVVDRWRHLRLCFKLGDLD